jgi:biopolymer transport protein ExbD
MADSPRKPKLSGATRKPLTNYYRGGNAEQKSPFEKRVPLKKKSLLLIKFIDVLVICLLLFLLIYSVLVGSMPNIDVNNTAYHSKEEYKAATAKLLGNVGNRTKITFNDHFVADNLQKQFPEIRDISIELPLVGQTPIVRLDISPPSFFLSSNGTVYVVDTEGTAIAKSLSLPQIRNLPMINDQSEFNVDIGKRVLSSSQAQFVKVLLEQLRHANVPVKALILPVAAQEMDLQTKDHPYYTKLFLGGDPLVETGQFLAARHQFDAKDQQPAEYLDVRVAGKIFYK